MAKIVLLIIVVLISVDSFPAQNTSSAVAIVTTYSQNERFYLRSIPYDNEFPTLRGRSSVYEVGSTTPIYEVDRGFDSVGEHTNNLILSNDGQIIFYALPSDAHEKTEGLKSITIYKHGEIVKSYTEGELTGCNQQRERCSLLYSNLESVFDQEKSNLGARNDKEVFKSKIGEMDRFLSDVRIWGVEEAVYRIDARKRVQFLGLTDGDEVGCAMFDKGFE